MSRHFSHLKTAATIIEQYRGEMPLHFYLKNFFSKEKKYGSKDRRTIGALCYYYFRLGHGEIERTIEERILLGIYLCENQPNEILQIFKPEWNEKMALPLQEKLHDIENFYPANIFKWKDELSEEIESATFSLSFLIQPNLYIRVRPGYYEVVRKKLAEGNVKYEDIAEDCIAFENGIKLDEVLNVNHEYVVQDYNSQNVGEFMKLANSGIEFERKNLKSEMENPKSVWDCCAASGGKSIMVCDIIKDINLTVTDVRPSILQNLQVRFKQAGIKDYSAYVSDLMEPNKIQTSPFDLVICDAPCSGSGTWGRTPEQLYYFKEDDIEKYSVLQKRIARNVIPHVKKDGYLLYVTCSVFEKENEGVVKYILKNSFMKLIKMEVLKGYSLKADTMFAALFQLV